MKILDYACNATDQKISIADATFAINKLVEEYKRVVRDEEYEQLVAAYQTQDPPNNEVNQKLIYSNINLVYCEQDGTEWKDVHPAVVRNNKFQQALQKK